MMHQLSFSPKDTVLWIYFYMNEPLNDIQLLNFEKILTRKFIGFQN